MNRWSFYKKNLLEYIDKKFSILIIGGSQKEFDLLKKLEYENVTISNFFPDQSKFSSKIIHVDATNIQFDDNSFDYVITHACIHHMRRPHSAILEMYRVSRVGTLIIEGNDSIIMRLSSKLGFSETFETSSLDKNNKSKGGVEESGIPNYVYRWTEREIFKTLASYEPNLEHKIIYKYANDLENTEVQNNRFQNIIYKCIKLLLKVFFIFFKKQQNLLSIYIDKKKSSKRIF